MQQEPTILSVSKAATTCFRLLLAAFALVFAQTSYAQTSTYVNGTDGTIDGSTTCAAPLTRTFVVGDTFDVGDVNLGFYATHSWRGDIQLTLISPANPGSPSVSVQLVDGDVNNTNGDNLNVLLDDAFGTAVNADDDTAAHSTAAPPPFANNFSPNSPLSAFNGVVSNGTWTLEICDLFPGADNGVFRHAELYLSPPMADLSLTKVTSGPPPEVGDPLDYILTLTNSAASMGTATSIVVTDALPSGVTFDSAIGTGGSSYNSGTGEWSVPSLAPGASVTLTISVTVTATAGATVTNEAEVTASSLLDPDSIVANGATGEDDYDSVSFTVDGVRTAGTPPTLFCPNGTAIFDWNAVTWTAGDTANTYALSTLGDIEFTITNPGTYFTSATYGGQSPTRQNVIHGGFGTGEFALAQIVDLPTTSDVVTTVIDLPTVMNGAQFRIFDIDYNAGQFADRVEVIGYNGAAVVLPTLTNGISNYVIGNEAFGDGLSADAQPNGNIVVTFSSPIDRIEILYGNHSLGSPTPGLQGIALHDITTCIRTTSLSVTKLSTILSDPVNLGTNPKAIPGAVVRYCILVNNPNDITVDSVVATDTLPSDLTFTAGTIRSGTSCGTATDVEDDDNAGPDENDPFGATIAGSTLTMTADSLGPTDTLAITFQATLN